MLKGMRRVLGAVAVLTVTAASVEAQTVTSHIWSGQEPTMSERVFRDGQPSDWQNPKAFPGTFGPGTFSWVVYAFVNPTAAANPFFVDIMQSTTTNSFFSVYAGGFDPTNLAMGYLGDAGSSFNVPPLDEQTFSVLVPGGTTAYVMISTAASGETFRGEELIFRTTYMNQQVIPEPMTMVLLGTGLLGIGLVRRRRAGRIE
jgi:hypothetical protein